MVHTNTYWCFEYKEEREEEGVMEGERGRRKSRNEEEEAYPSATHDGRQAATSTCTRWNGKASCLERSRLTNESPWAFGLEHPRQGWSAFWFTPGLVHTTRFILVLVKRQTFDNSILFFISMYLHVFMSEIPVIHPFHIVCPLMICCIVRSYESEIFCRWLRIFLVL